MALFLFIGVSWAIGTLTVTWSQVYKNALADVIVKTEYSILGIKLVFLLLAFVFWIPYWLYYFYGRFLQKNRPDLLQEGYPLHEQALDRLTISYWDPLKNEFFDEDIDMVEDMRKAIYQQRIKEIENSVDSDHPIVVTPFGKISRN